MNVCLIVIGSNVVISKTDYLVKYCRNTITYPARINFYIPNEVHEASGHFQEALRISENVLGSSSNFLESSGRFSRNKGILPSSSGNFSMQFKDYFRSFNVLYINLQEFQITSHEVESISQKMQ